LTDLLTEHVRTFLLGVFGVSDEASRGVLLQKLPADLVGDFDRHSAPLDDIRLILSAVTGWGRLNDDRQAVEVMLENVRERVRQTEREGQLDELVGQFRGELRDRWSAAVRVATDPAGTAAQLIAARQLADEVDRQIDDHVFEALARAFSSTTDSQVRAWLAWALGHTGRPEAVRVLIDAGADAHPLVGQAVADALSNLNFSRERR
jgi:hypothetical protein